MRSSFLCLLLFALAGAASAQSKIAAASSSPTVQMNGALKELYFRSIGDGSQEAKDAAAQKADAEYQRRLFYDKAKHFVDLWTKMTKQMNQQETFDAKLARKVSNAFHDLERSEGWPVRDGK